MSKLKNILSDLSLLIKVVVYGRAIKHGCNLTIS